MVGYTLNVIFVFVSFLLTITEPFLFKFYFQHTKITLSVYPTMKVFVYLFYTFIHLFRGQSYGFSYGFFPPQALVFNKWFYPPLFSRFFHYSFYNLIFF